MDSEIEATTTPTTTTSTAINCDFVANPPEGVLKLPYFVRKNIQASVKIGSMAFLNITFKSNSKWNASYLDNMGE